MATIAINNVPDRLHQKLKARATYHRRSMNNEAIECLEEALHSASSRDPERLISEAEALNRRVGKILPDIVNEAKKEGRP